MSKLKLYNIDCMEYMATLPNKAFDLAIVDPPYGIGCMSMNYTTSGSVRTHGHSAANRRDYRKHTEWDIMPTKEYFDELFRVSKNQIIWGGNYFSELLPSSKSFVCWDKRCNNDMTNDFSDCEYAWASSGVARMFRFVWNGMIQGDMKNKEERFHPTQKPVALYKWLLSRYAKPGDRILDTHGGSGSICIACHDLGYDLTWMELDADYYKAACKRYKDHAAQAVLFEPQEIRQKTHNNEFDLTS